MGDLVGRLNDGVPPAVDGLTGELTGLVSGTGSGQAGGLTARLPVTAPVLGPVTAPLSGSVSGPLTGTAGGLLDQLVTGLAGTVESTIRPLGSTVDPLLPGLIEDVTEVVNSPPPGAVPPLDLTDQLAPIVELLIPPDSLAVAPAPAAGSPAPFAGPDPPGDPPVPLGPPPRADLPSQPAGPGAQPGGTGVQMAAARGGDSGATARPRPIPPPSHGPSASLVRAHSFDLSQPFPLAGQPTAPAAPDYGPLRSVEDDVATGLVMSISAPPG